MNFRWLRGPALYILVAVLPVFGLSLAVSSAELNRSDGVALTKEEKSWIAEHPVIRLTPDPLFPPFEYFDEDGKFSGIGADFVALLEKKLGLRFKIVRVKDWKDSVARTKRQENDVWSVVAKTPERSEYMLFTKPYIESPAIIVVPSGDRRQLTVEDLKGLKVAISSGYAVHENLRQRFPDMAFDAVPDPMTGLKKVSFGLADAMVINIALASHMMEKAAMSNLRMAGEVGYVYKWGFASRKDWPKLQTILEKGLAQITLEERQAITRKWVALKEQPFVITKALVFWILGVLGVLGVASVLVWNRSLKRQVRLRTLEFESELKERQTAEAALQNSERILSAAIESISDGFVLIDADGKFVLSNSRFRNLYPNSHDLIQKGAKFEAFLRGGAERGEFLNAAGRIEDWVSQRMAETDQNTAIVEDQLIGDRWVRAASRRLPSGGRVSIHVDFTELKQTQEALQDRAELIQLLRQIAGDSNDADNLQEAMRDVLDGVCDYMDWPVGHVYIRSEDDLELLVPTDIWHLDDPVRYAKFRDVSDRTTFAPGIGLPGRVFADGKPDWIFDVTKDPNFPRANLADDIGVKAGLACPVLVGEEVVAVLEFFAPNTVEPDQSLLDTLVQVGLLLGRVAERERSEMELRARQSELEALNDQKNKFFSIIAHDLKGPFTSLLGGSDLLVNLSKNASRDQLATLAQSVNEGGKRVFALLENLLEWSRFQMDNVKIEPKTLDLQSIIQPSVDLLNPIAEDKDLTITNEVTGIEVFADPQIVETVVRNLISNAIKFTEKSGSITVSAKMIGEWAEVIVTDTGVGIPKEKLSKLFDLGEKTSTAGTRGEALTGQLSELGYDLYSAEAPDTVADGTANILALPKGGRLTPAPLMDAWRARMIAWNG